jgi:N-acetylglutamate synthase-like GNAT family acetyltransferase
MTCTKRTRDSPPQATAELTIRKMRRSDMSAAIKLLEAWNMAPRPPSRSEPDPERSSLIVENSFVAVWDGRIVGVCSYLLGKPGEAETASLAVDPSCLGQGVGHRLQQARLEEMRARSVRKVRTETDRPETIRWYVSNFGYRIVGTNPKKHAFGLADVDVWTVLELDLEE